MTTKYGRDMEQWQELVDAAAKALKRTASLERQSNYTDLNREISERTGHPGFDFSLQSGRSAMGDLLGDLVEQTYHEHKVMLSAVVLYLNENKPGAGFYNLAAHMGLLSKDASPAEKDAFWVGQYGAAIAAYKRPKRRRSHSGDH